MTAIPSARTVPIRFKNARFGYQQGKSRTVPGCSSLPDSFGEYLPGRSATGLACPDRIGLPEGEPWGRESGGF